MPRRPPNSMLSVSEARSPARTCAMSAASHTNVSPVVRLQRSVDKIGFHRSTLGVDLGRSPDGLRPSDVISAGSVSACHGGPSISGATAEMLRVLVSRSCAAPMAWLGVHRVRHLDLDCGQTHSIALGRTPVRRRTPGPTPPSAVDCRSPRSRRFSSSSIGRRASGSAPMLPSSSRRHSPRP